MIARIWRGVTRAHDAEAYLAYLHATGFPEYRQTPGTQGVLALRRLDGDRAEFLLDTVRDSPDAIARFAGDRPDQAVFYPEDDRFLVERGERVTHYEVVYQTEGAAS